MGGRPITFFLFVSFIMGSIVGFLGATQFQNSSRISKEDELALKEELLACQETKQKNEPKKWAQPEKELPSPAHTKIFIDQAPIQKSFPEGNLSYFEVAGQKSKPLHIPGAKLLQMFPSKTFAIKNAENVGIENSTVGDVKTFLDQHLCIDPSFSVMTEEQKNRTKFFDVVKDDSFKGNTIISSAGGKTTLNTAMLFNSPTHGGFDYLETSDKKKNVVEKRMIESEGTNEAWRYNSCQPSVVLLSDRCPWNDRFEQEFKDFFVSPDSKKLIGNIYCKKTADTHWTNLGTFELDQTTEDSD